jgi:hypothetical protein
MPWAKLTIDGTFSGEVTITPTSSGYSISGLTAGDRLKLSASDLKLETDSVTSTYVIPKGTTAVNVTYKRIDDTSAQIIVISDSMAILDEDTTVYGDINGDGVVNILDVIELKSYIFGGKTNIVTKVADISADGEVDLIDLVLLKKKILGMNEVW